MAEGLSSPATFALPRKLSHLTPSTISSSVTLLRWRFWIPRPVIMCFSLALLQPFREVDSIFGIFIASQPFSNGRSFHSFTSAAAQQVLISVDTFSTMTIRRPFSRDNLFVPVLIAILYIAFFLYGWKIYLRTWLEFLLFSFLFAPSLSNDTFLFSYFFNHVKFSTNFVIILKN